MLLMDGQHVFEIRESLQRIQLRVILPGRRLLLLLTLRLRLWHLNKLPKQLLV